MIQLSSPRLELRELILDHLTEEYLEWLNDVDVLRYRGHQATPIDRARQEAYIRAIPDRGDVVLAMHLDGRHIGNVTLNSIDRYHRSAELSILLGDKGSWGKGLAKEAIATVTRHAFDELRLHRVWAQSPNPAFNAAVRSLGWTHEGTLREAFLLDGRFLDIECHAVLSG